MTIADHASNLHSPPYDLERIGHRLGKETREAARAELSPALQLRRLVRCCLRLGAGGVREGSPGREDGVAEEIADGVVREEGRAGIGNHAEQGGREAAEEVGEAGLRDALFHDRCGGRGERVRGVVRRRCALLVVDLCAYAPQRAALLRGRLERQAHAYHFQGIGEEDGEHACETAAEEAPGGGLVGLGAYEDGADLVVGEELYAGVGEDAEEGGGVAFEEAADAVFAVDVAQREVQA